MQTQRQAVYGMHPSTGTPAGHYSPHSNAACCCARGLLFKLQCPGLPNSTAVRLSIRPGCSPVQANVCLPVHVAILLHATRPRLLTCKAFTHQASSALGCPLFVQAVSAQAALCFAPRPLACMHSPYETTQAAYLCALLHVCMVLLHGCDADIHGLLLHLCCHVCVLHQGVLGHSAGAVRPSSGTSGTIRQQEADEVGATQWASDSAETLGWWNSIRQCADSCLRVGVSIGTESRLLKAMQTRLLESSPEWSLATLPGRTQSSA